jgi:hypothetical protein
VALREEAVAFSTEDQERLSAALARGWATQHPAAAADFLARAVHDVEVLGPALDVIITQWAQVDAAGLEQWISKFPAGEIQAHARDTSVRALSGLEPSTGGPP